MAANYKDRLQNLRNRRLGLDSSSVVLDSAAALREARESYSFGAPSYTFEAYEQRGKEDATKYALGSMQEVDPDYTRISFEQGERVKNQLSSWLTIPATFDYQGSVPLNIHIRGVSDIDLLVLHDGFVTLDWSGPKASSYTRCFGSVIDDMINLRSECEKILDENFPAATVDKSGAKSVSISGGSLRRKVDVVPSHWHDTASYQVSREKHDREIRVLDKTIPDTLANQPFMHMKRIEDKDLNTEGGTKKVIRLLKSLSSDCDEEVKLTSYDIASLVWHFNNQSLSVPKYLELSLLAVTQLQLWTFIANRSHTESLYVPDGSRKIINSSNKFDSLVLLSREVDELAADVARELDPFSTQTASGVRKSLSEAIIY